MVSFTNSKELQEVKLSEEMRKYIPKTKLSRKPKNPNTLTEFIQVKVAVNMLIKA